MMRKLTFLLLWVTVLNLEAQNTGIDLLRDINLNRNKNLDNTYLAISKTEAAISLSVPVIVTGIGFLKHNNSIKSDGFTIAASSVLTSIISTSMKYTFNRVRPYITYPELDNVTNKKTASFPSGHTSAAFSTATSLSLEFPKWYVIVPSYAWASTVAYSRLHLGVHYPGDVLAGALIGSGCAFLAYKGQKIINHRKNNLSD